MPNSHHFAASRCIAVLACVALVSAHARVLAGSNTYKYDSLGRLSEVITSDGVDITFSYDATGNRVIEKTTGSKVTAPSAAAAVISIINQLLLAD